MMEAMRSTWTDERLDDLSRRMDAGFQRVDSEIRELRGEMHSEFAGLRSEMNARFDTLQRTMIGVMGSILVAFAGLFISHL
jgi:hypothetical protein